MRRLLLLPLTLALAGCPPPIDLGSDGSGDIYAGPQGGIFFRDGAGIVIPAGALDGPTLITVVVVDTGIPDIPTRKRVSLGYRLGPPSLVLKQPIEVGIPWLQDRVPQGVTPPQFDLRRNRTDEPYLALPAPSVFDGKAILARTDQLGTFWVTSPDEASITRVELSPNQATLAVGGMQQFTASVKDPAGNDMPEVTVTWSVAPARVATVDANGLVTATAAGNATLTARAGELTATAKLFVQGDAVGPQTFLHENPFPTGNDLHGGALALGQAFFVGGNATVLSRSPSGDWQRQFSSPGVVLKAIAGSPAHVVAVGVSGTSGLLVELKAGAMAPAVQTFASVEPRALWFDGVHGMAVGYGNDVIVRRGDAWVTEYSPSVETLLSVVGDGVGGFTTVGSRGSIYRFDPATQTWNSLFQSQLSVLLTAGWVKDVDGTEAWAAGGGKLWRFDGAWTPINLPATPAVSELTALGAIDGKIALAGVQGKQGHLFLYSPGDGSWTSTPVRKPQVIRGIFGSGAEGYAVGELGAVWRYAGGTFLEESKGFYGQVSDVSVVAQGAEEVVAAAVNECVDDACASRVGRVMLRTAPFTWTELGAPSPQPFTTPVRSVLVRSASEIYAGGDGVVFRFNGSGWTQVPLTGGAPVPILDLASCGTTLYAVGPAGSNFRGTASLANQPQLGQNNLHALFCGAEDQVWIAGDGALFENRIRKTTQGVNHGPWRTVWSPAAGEAFAFGDARYGLYWDTERLNIIDMPGGILPEVLSGMWGSSIDNLYLVGSTVIPAPFGVALRFDGAQWRLVDSGSQRPLTSIHGASNTVLWLGSAGGGLLRGVPPSGN